MEFKEYMRNKTIAERVNMYKKYRNDRGQFKKDFKDIHSGYKLFLEEFTKQTDGEKGVSYFRFWREWLFDIIFDGIEENQTDEG